MSYFDSHQHFWSLTNSFSTWPTRELESIYRDFGPDDLAPHLDRTGVEGTILIQVEPSQAETIYLLKLAGETPFVRGVVGWIDFEAEDALKQLDDIAADPILKGVRPMVQAIAEPNWLLRPEFSAVFEGLIARSLSFDALIRKDQIGQVIELGRRYPDLNIVIDHAAKPDIAGNAIDEWAQDIARAAEVPSIFCKLSGLWTEAGLDTSIERIAPYAKHVIQAFGANRVMWGSDWPVLGLAGAYDAWLDQTHSIIAHLSQQEQRAILSQTAKHFYNVY